MKFLVVGRHIPIIFDALAGSIMNMFDFNGTNGTTTKTHMAGKLLLDPSTGIQNTTK
jgi:hypothetical protein